MQSRRRSGRRSRGVKPKISEKGTDSSCSPSRIKAASSSATANRRRSSLNTCQARASRCGPAAAQSTGAWELPTVDPSRSGAKSPALRRFTAEVVWAHRNESLFHRRHPRVLRRAAHNHHQPSHCAPSAALRGWRLDGLVRGASERLAALVGLAGEGLAAQPPRGRGGGRRVARRRRLGHLGPRGGGLGGVAGGGGGLGADRGSQILVGALLHARPEKGREDVEGIIIIIIFGVDENPKSLGNERPVDDEPIVLPRRRHAGGHRGGGEPEVVTLPGEGQTLAVVLEEHAAQSLLHRPRPSRRPRVRLAIAVGRVVVFATCDWQLVFVLLLEEPVAHVLPDRRPRRRLTCVRLNVAVAPIVTAAHGIVGDAAAHRTHALLQKHWSDHR
mmetsp:Transcript_122842/g.352809  ORF Transcript_122842/g.352809 Transcript_122842/m.352809 type:complete len:387 (+) Transcript_122842:312-1472(+)